MIYFQNAFVELNICKIQAGRMTCGHCGRTDEPLQCKCYTWFVRTCVMCVVTVLIGLTCCLYCTYVVVSLTRDIKTCPDQRQQTIVMTEEHREVSLLQGDEMETVETSYAHISKIRSRRKAKDPKKPKPPKEKRRRGKGERGKKTIAAHYVLKKGLVDPGANCPIGSKTGSPASVIQPTLDVFEAAPFVKAKTNPLIMIDGKFIVKKKGLYLVYAQVGFEDCKEHAIMRIVQSRRVNNFDVVIQEHSCFVGVPNAKTSYNNTCSMTSLFFLEENDYLSVVNHYPEVHINYRNNSTFFGAVYLR